MINELDLFIKLVPVKLMIQTIGYSKFAQVDFLDFLFITDSDVSGFPITVLYFYGPRSDDFIVKFYDTPKEALLVMKEYYHIAIV